MMKVIAIKKGTEKKVTFTGVSFAYLQALKVTHNIVHAELETK